MITTVLVCYFNSIPTYSPSSNISIHNQNFISHFPTCFFIEKLLVPDMDKSYKHRNLFRPTSSHGSSSPLLQTNPYQLATNCSTSAADTIPFLKHKEPQSLKTILNKISILLHTNLSVYFGKKSQGLEAEDVRMNFDSLCVKCARTLYNSSHVKSHH